MFNFNRKFHVHHILEYHAFLGLLHVQIFFWKVATWKVFGFCASGLGLTNVSRPNPETLLAYPLNLCEPVCLPLFLPGPRMPTPLTPCQFQFWNNPGNWQSSGKSRKFWNHPENWQSSEKSGQFWNNPENWQSSGKIRRVLKSSGKLAIIWKNQDRFESIGTV